MLKHIGGISMKDILNNELYEAFAQASEIVYIYVCDMKTDLSRWSENAVDYFNLPGEYIQNAGEMWTQHIHPDDRNIYLEDIEGVFGGTKAQHNCKYRALNKYGSYVWVECRGSVIKGKDGTPAVFAGIMTRLDGQNKYDFLTNLMTLNEFYQQDFSVGSGAVMLMGIDDFRKIITSRGYEFGDNVLVMLAKLFQTVCGDEVPVYRFGGDEFLIVKQNGTLEEMTAIFNRISKEADGLKSSDGQILHIEFSGGLNFYPTDGTTKEKLINKLENSLGYAKQHRRGHLVVFNQEIAEHQKRAQLLLEDLKNSIRNDFKGFELYFQPLVEKENQSIIGCESLLRWKGEHIKDSYPLEFIKVLEDHGDIQAVGQWVMEQALSHQKKWQERYPGFHVSFNVSYQQFMNGHFVDKLIEKAKEIGVEAGNMIVELTESSEVEEAESLAQVFRRLREEGFTIALDDFGTAYASLQMLMDLPVNYIKIEHSFVKNLAEPGHENDYIIIENLLSLCRRLGCSSVVEGVENEVIESAVKKTEATYLQGYYYSRPIPEADFDKMLEKNRGR